MNPCITATFPSPMAATGAAASRSRHRPAVRPRPRLRHVRPHRHVGSRRSRKAARRPSPTDRPDRRILPCPFSNADTNPQSIQHSLLNARKNRIGIRHNHFLVFFCCSRSLRTAFFDTRIFRQRDVTDCRQDILKVLFHGSLSALSFQHSVSSSIIFLASSKEIKLPSSSCASPKLKYIPAGQFSQ